MPRKIQPKFCKCDITTKINEFGLKSSRICMIAFFSIFFLFVPYIGFTVFCGEKTARSGNYHCNITGMISSRNYHQLHASFQKLQKDIKYLNTFAAKEDIEIQSNLKRNLKKLNIQMKEMKDQIEFQDSLKRECAAQIDLYEGKEIKELWRNVSKFVRNIYAFLVAAMYLCFWFYLPKYGIKNQRIKRYKNDLIFVFYVTLTIHGFAILVSIFSDGFTKRA